MWGWFIVSQQCEFLGKELISRQTNEVLLSWTERCQILTNRLSFIYKTYCWLFWMLRIDYWFQLSSADFEDIWNQWQSLKRRRCQKLRLRLVYGCLSSGNHLNSFYFEKQTPRGNIKTFNLLSEQTVEGGSSRLCRHTLPQAQPFIYQTLPHQGGCCYFRLPIMFFLSLNFPEVSVCCWAAEAKTHTATHTDGDWLEEFCLLPGIEVLASTLTGRGVEGVEGEEGETLGTIRASLS